MTTERYTMKHARKAIATLALTTGLVLAPSAAAHAELAYRTPDRCHGSPVLHDVNRWTFAENREVRVSASQCHNGTFIKWAGQPRVTFPRGNVKVTYRPHVKSVRHFIHGASQIIWQFGYRTTVFGVPVGKVQYMIYATYPTRNQVCEIKGPCESTESAWIG